MGLSFSALLVVGGCIAVVCVVALVCGSGSTSRYPPLLSEAPLPKLLLLGPASSGKTTLFRAAVALAGERPDDAPLRPTRGLVRVPLALPTAGGWKQQLIACDAGGAPKERRQWIDLVRDRTVGGLLFVADVADASDETRYLFKQLASAPWSQRAAIVLALNKIDLLAERLAAQDGARGDERLRQACAARADEYRAVCARPFSVHYVSAHDPVDASTLLVDASSSISEALKTAES
jgi:hypothetical protein